MMFDAITWDRFDAVQGAISDFTALIEKFAKMISNFVASMKKEWTLTEETVAGGEAGGEAA